MVSKCKIISKKTISMKIQFYYKKKKCKRREHFNRLQTNSTLFCLHGSEVNHLRYDFKRDEVCRNARRDCYQQGTKRPNKIQKIWTVDLWQESNINIEQKYDEKEGLPLFSLGP